MYAKRADIWACCQYKNDDFEKHISLLSSLYNVNIIPIYFDLSKEDEIKNGIKSIVSYKKQIDVLINIAGMTQNSLLHMTPLSKMRELFEIDFFSQIYIIQQISKIMMRNKSGSIINISSITATDGNSGQISYSSAKAALIGASKTLSIELGKFGIRVNSISPGVIYTDMTKELSKDIFDGLLSNCKLKRFGLPKEVADLLLFLSSDLSSYITGQNIRIDGGIGG